MPQEQASRLVKLKEPGTSLAAHYFAGGLLATDVAIAIQLLQLSTLSTSLTVALWCVALSAPGLAFDFVLDLYTKERGHVLLPRPGDINYTTVNFLVMVLAVVAMGAVIHHFIPAAAYAFAAVAALAFYRLRMYISTVEDALERTGGASEV